MEQRFGHTAALGLSCPFTTPRYPESLQAGPGTVPDLSGSYAVRPLFRTKLPDPPLEIPVAVRILEAIPSKTCCSSAWTDQNQSERPTQRPASRPAVLAASTARNPWLSGRRVLLPPC